MRFLFCGINSSALFSFFGLPRFFGRTSDIADSIFSPFSSFTGTGATGFLSFDFVNGWKGVRFLSMPNVLSMPDNLSDKDLSDSSLSDSASSFSSTLIRCEPLKLESKCSSDSNLAENVTDAAVAISGM